MFHMILCWKKTWLTFTLIIYTLCASFILPFSSGKSNIFIFFYPGPCSYSILKILCVTLIFLPVLARVIFSYFQQLTETHLHFCLRPSDWLTPSLTDSLSDWLSEADLLKLWLIDFSDLSIVVLTHLCLLLGLWN